jgi:hypothetical protein
MSAKLQVKTGFGIAITIATLMPLAAWAALPQTSGQTVAPPVAAKPPVPPVARQVTRPGLAAELEKQFRALDTNKDNMVTQVEIAASASSRQQQIRADIRKRREATFNAMDANKDGQLSRAEFLANDGTDKQPRPDGAKAMARFDANKDGRVTLAEYSTRPLAEFDRGDVNRDGVLSPDELRKLSGRR